MTSFFPKREQPIHLLLTCVAAAGHINPLVQLAHCLVEPRANKPTCYVTLGVLTNDNIRGKVHLPQHDRIRVFSEQEFDITKWVQNIETMDAQIAEEMTPRVIQSHLHWPPVDAVVFDFISTFGQQIAQKLRVPSFTYLASPLFCFWSILRHDELSALRNQPEPPKSYCIPGIGDFTLLTGDDEEKERKGVWDKMCKVCIEAYKKADGCLANDVQSWYSEEFIASLPPSPLPSHWKVLCCGPLALKDQRLTVLPRDSSKDEVHLFASRFPPRSILFIALGSCWSLKSQDLVELVRGVAATGRPFIFAHRGKSDNPFAAFGPKDTPASEATEEDGLPLGFRDEVKERGLIVSWVNQPRLLGHPSIGAFMTHCGWNSIMEGMSFGGVPYLLLPIGGDQQANAEFLGRHLRCGKLVKGFEKNEALERTKVSQVIEEVFNDQDLKDQAQRLHHLVRQESVENGVSEMNLMKFFDRIMESKVVS